jgi:hypothetical protein
LPPGAEGEITYELRLRLSVHQNCIEKFMVAKEVFANCCNLTLVKNYFSRYLIENYFILNRYRKEFEPIDQTIKVSLTHKFFTIISE